MPIKGLSDQGRLPRKEVIKIGEILCKACKSPCEAKDEYYSSYICPKCGEIPRSKTYPHQLDYFVVTDPELISLLGTDKPRELNVIFGSTNFDSIFDMWYKSYGNTEGLKCKGNGETASFADNKGVLVERECPCEQIEAKACKRIGVLTFLIPEMSGWPVYQIRTSGINTILNIQGALKAFIKIFGEDKLTKVRWKLRIERQQARPNVDGKKLKTVISTLVLEPAVPFIKIAQQKTLEFMEGTVPAELEDKTAAAPKDDLPDELVHEGREGTPEAEDAPDPEAEQKSAMALLFDELAVPADIRMKFPLRYADKGDALKILIELRGMVENLNGLVSLDKMWEKCQTIEGALDTLIQWQNKKGSQPKPAAPVSKPSPATTGSPAKAAIKEALTTGAKRKYAGGAL